MTAVRVQHTGDANAAVATDTIPSHPMWNYFYTGDHN